MTVPQVKEKGMQTVVKMKPTANAFAIRNTLECTPLPMSKQPVLRKSDYVMI